MAHFIDKRRIPSDLPNNGIVIYLYQPRTDDSDTYNFLVFEKKDCYTVEELCVECAKHLLIKPYSIPLLGLASVKHSQYWPCLSREVKTPPDSTTIFVLRIRYRIPCEKVRELWDCHSEIVKYFFWQMLDDLVNDRVQGLEEGKTLGYICLASYCTSKSDSKVVYTKFVPPSVKKQYQRVDKKIQLKIQLKTTVKDITDEYKQKQLDESDAIRSMVLGLLNGSDSYLNETYSVVTEHDGQRWHLCITPESVALRKPPEQRGKVYQNISLDESCYSYDEILHCVGKTEDIFVLSLLPDPPKFLRAESFRQMESILGVIDGYYRLVVNYYHHLNVMHTGRTVGPPSLEELRKLRAHGPLTRSVCRNLLRGKNTGDYILKQHNDVLGNYMITLNHGSPPIAKSVPIERSANGYTCDIIVGQAFASVKEILENLAKVQLNGKLQTQLLFRDEQSLLMCRIAEIPTEDIVEEQINASLADADTKFISRKAVDVKDVVDKGTYTQISSAFYKSKKVAVKHLLPVPEVYRIGDLMEALQTGIYKASLWSDTNIVRVEALCLHAPFLAVLEYCPHGSLDKYLRHCDRLVCLLDLLNIMYDLAMAIGYLQSINDYHGNIRCRNLLVMRVDEGLKCKLADPGIASLYDRARPDHPLCVERAQWVAPEILKTHAEPSPQTDIYSFGITFLELFYHVKNETFAFYEPLKQPPEACPPKILELINQCCAEPMDRKTQKDILRDVWQMIVSINPDGNRYENRHYRLPNDSATLSSLNTDAFTDTSRGQRCELANPVLNAKCFDKSAIVPDATPPLPNTLPPKLDMSVDLVDAKLCQSGASTFSYGSFNSTTPLLPCQSASGQTVLSLLSELSLSHGDRSRTITPSTSVESMTNSQAPLLPRDRMPSNKSVPPPLPVKRHVIEQTNLGFSAGSSGVDRQDFTSYNGPHLIGEISIEIDSIPRSRLHFDKKDKRLGSGHYGVVLKAYLNEDPKEKPNAPRRECAVKRLQHVEKQTEEQESEFLKEINIMAQLDHPNIVRIIGMCIAEGNHPLCLVMEYVERGSLKTYIQKDTSTDTTQQLQFCLEIAEGMLYLSENNIIHRDLAARNVLVTKENRMKISDFGLARRLDPFHAYYMSSSSKELPALWCALEGLKFRRFTTKGDVWSFGVTIWEIFSHGQKPSLDDDLTKMYMMLLEGKRLPKPKDCPDNVYEEVMLKCWDEDPNKRYGFSTVRSKLLEIKPMISLST